MLETRLTKQQILELYLNRVYLSGGLYGVEAMSMGLFGKHANAVTLAEAALIAGLVQAPSALSPWSNLDGARRRSDLVLRRMQSAGLITQAQANMARRQRLRIRPYPVLAEARHGYAKAYLRQQFRNRFGGDRPADWQVHTTLLPALQDAAEQAVASGLRRLGIRNLQAALVAIDANTGQVLAVVGGSDFTKTTFNRAVHSRRQPGSAFKPILYAAALEHKFSPVTVLSGLAALPPQGREEWTPRNVSGEIEDQLTLREAFIDRTTAPPLQGDGGAVVRLDERFTQRQLIFDLARDVARRPLLAALWRQRREAAEDGHRTEIVFERGGVQDWLEGRSRLAAAVDGAIECGLREVAAADDGQHLPSIRIDRNQRRL